ncbi:MAG: hypothetical protein WD750_01640 [Gammaproteobacteria bacterium]
MPKDYITTEEGLYFAVVLHGIAGWSVHCSLRYVLMQDGSPLKVGTDQAIEFLQKNHSHFIAYSELLDAEAVLVPTEKITTVYKPGAALKQIEHSSSGDKLKQTAAACIEIFVRNGIRRNVFGITGSLLLDFHNAGSDIDMVFYDSEAFRMARDIIRKSANGTRLLDDAEWLDAYRRRGCMMDFNEYKKHEIRKYNKFMLYGTKIDISYVPLQKDQEYKPPVNKLGPSTIRGKVTDDSRVFDYPARYITDNPEIRQIYCYTATYTGQAFAGEYIEASGMLERDAEGRQYLVIGTSREAPGEYIRVIGL